jgi:hypothetical protein
VQRERERVKRERERERDVSLALAWYGQASANKIEFGPELLVEPRKLLELASTN